MAIKTSCPGCQKQYNLADEQAGLRVRCTACQTDFDVPRVQTVTQWSGPMMAPPAALPASAALDTLKRDEDEPLARTIVRDGPPRRWLYYVGAGMAGTLLLITLACAGGAWWLTGQFKVAIAQVNRQLEEAEKIADQAKNDANKAKDDADRAKKEAEDAKQRIAALEQKTKVIQKPVIDINKLDLSKLDLNNLDGLMAQLSPDDRERLKAMLSKLNLPTTQIRNLDDALKKLSSRSRGDRLAALKYLQTAMRPGDEREKAIRAALVKIISEETDEALVNEAKTAKLLFLDEL